jgi:large subunit ribosomal protein L20
MFSDRKKKKRNFRRLWTLKLNAAAREHGLTYSRLIPQLKAANIELDRKVLAEIAEHHPETFQQIIAIK